MNIHSLGNQPPQGVPPERQLRVDGPEGPNRPAAIRPAPHQERAALGIESVEYPEIIPWVLQLSGLPEVRADMVAAARARWAAGAYWTAEAAAETAASIARSGRTE
jgi:hypothetical protein